MPESCLQWFKRMFGANVAYLFLFPFFYFAYLGSAAGFWEASSYFGVVSIAVVVIYTLLFPIPVIRRMGASWGKSTAFIALLLWCASWTAWNWFATSDYPIGAFKQILQILIQWSALFFVGMFVDPSRKRIFQACFLSILAMLAISILYIDTSIGMVDLRSAFDVENIPSYQGFASATMFTALILLAAIRKLYWRILWAITCAAMLFVQGARSEFAGFVVAVAIVDGIELLRQPKAVLMIGVAAIPASFGATAAWPQIEQSRQFQLLDIGNASSWVARQKFLEFAMDQIAAHPFLGVFAGHLEWEWPVSLGAYAHNVMSVWVSFGLIGFILYLVLTLLCATVSFKSVMRARDLPVMRLAAYVNIMCLFLIIASESAFWPAVALGWGLAINTAARMKEAGLCQQRQNMAARVIEPLSPTGQEGDVSS